MEILGYKLYMTGFTLFLMIPFIFWMWVVFVRWRQVRNDEKQESIQCNSLKRAVIISLVAFVVMHIDILFISYKANKVCKEQGGMHIYKTAETEGFLGAWDIEAWSKLGFKYVERHKRGKKFRYVMEDGKAKKFEVDKFISRYQETWDNEIIGSYLKKYRYAIVDRETDGVLGERVFFSVYPGWVDGYFHGIAGLTFTPWFCGKELDYLVEKTLIPKS